MRKMCLMGLLMSGVWLVASVALATDPTPGQQQGTHVNVQKGEVHAQAGNKDEAKNTMEQKCGDIAKASDLIGLRVYNRNNENLGKIDDLVIDAANGKVRYAVLASGGFLGMGERLFAVPWNQLSRTTKGTTTAGTEKEEYYVLDMNKQALERAPGFDKNKWPNFADPNWIANIDRFYANEQARRSGTVR